MRFCGMVALTVLTRKHDETRFWADYTLPSRSDYIVDDAGVAGGLTPGELFVIAGDQNSSSALFEAEQFGGDSGLKDRIYFTGEEDGGEFNPVGGGEWALDPETGSIWHAPAMGRGAWENVTEVDTGTSTHVAFILADDSSPFDFDDDGDADPVPLYLYIGTKEPGATVPSGARDFLSENGLRNGKLFVWVADSGVTRPSQFNANSRITDFDLREGGQLLILGRNGAITRGKKK